MALTSKSFVFKTPDEWCQLMNVVIADADGWRFGIKLGDGTNYEPKSWDEKVTEEEFRVRAQYSTVVQGFGAL